MKYIYITILIFLHTIAIARTPLTGNDITYLGGFQVPLVVNTSFITTYGYGLALRRVNGNVRLFSTGYQSNNFSLFEMSVPTLTSGTPWNTATVAKDWGNVFTDKQGWINGLYWDETDQRLYYSSSWNYVAGGDPYEPSIAYLAIDGDSSATSHGRWGLTNRSVKQVNMGLLGVPSDFASTYLSGKRLAAGFGGYQSNMAFGPVSMGPSLAAFNPPTTEPEGGTLANTSLVGYPLTDWTSGSRPTVDRCWRDDNFINDHQDYADPDSSFGGSNNSLDILAHVYSGDETFYWQGYSVTGNTRLEYPNQNTTTIGTKHWELGKAFWSLDYVGGGAWVQTANKEGVVFVGDFSVGRVIYVGSQLYVGGIDHKWLIYDRDQMASVAQSSVAQDQIQPAQYDLEFSSIPYPRTGDWLGTSSTSINAASATVNLTTQDDLAYTVGMPVNVVCDTNHDVYFRGNITAYSGTSMTINNTMAGTGTCADWYIFGQEGGGFTPYTTHGMAYDSVDQRLYVAVSYSSTAPVVNASTTYTIHVFQINDTTAALGQRFKNFKVYVPE